MLFMVDHVQVWSYGFIVQVNAYSRTKVMNLPSLKKEVELTREVPISARPEGSGGGDGTSVSHPAAPVRVVEPVVRKSVYRNRITDVEVDQADRLKSYKCKLDMELIVVLI